MQMGKSKHETSLHEVAELGKKLQEPLKKEVKTATGKP
jgi:hypothetical protein